MWLGREQAGVAGPPVIPRYLSGCVRNRFLAVAARGGGESPSPGAAAARERSSFDEIIELTKQRHQLPRFVAPIELPNRIRAHCTLPRKRPAFLDDLSHARQQNKLQPLIEAHRVGEERLSRLVSRGRRGLRLPHLETA